MKRIFLIGLFFAIVSNSLLGQAPNVAYFPAPDPLIPSENGQIEIQFVEIKDSIMRVVLNKFIEMESENDSLFAAGYGIIVIEVGSGKALNKVLSDVDTIAVYAANLNFMHPNSLRRNGLEYMNFYPAYFSIYNNKLINIGNETSYLLRSLGYSKRSADIYEKVAEGYLEPDGAASREVIKLDFLCAYVVRNRKTREIAIQFEYRKAGRGN